ncbi:metallophosphatase family protein [Mucilaginibacter daejeonensis]|uniref:metallophosphoesterase family protein n=1 Tax=Mucilaginibacter daejeonensis TaxID=398049 RepID=UPI001D179667|nr:metallophosphoesterase family protein [Mucilaginibacter daejeonensis]UEG51425.1 metallophosphatase family protein [Mucilaginibacter daejeonensis]
MRIALFSDVHANLPAFEALLASVDERKPDAVYCLGDLIGYNIWPNEVIAEVRKRGIATLKGNHDEKTKGYAYELVTADNRAYLNTLPAHIRLEYADFQILLVHGSPRKIDEYVLEDMPEDEVIQMMDAVKADILCVAHSHLPYHRNISDKQVINTGSVGKPKDGDPRGGYVILTIGGNIKAEFIRFDYDIKKAANAIIDSPLSDELAERLRKAF